MFLKFAGGLKCVPTTRLAPDLAGPRICYRRHFREYFIQYFLIPSRTKRCRYGLSNRLLIHSVGFLPEQRQKKCCGFICIPLYSYVALYAITFDLCQSTYSESQSQFYVFPIAKFNL